MVSIEDFFKLRITPVENPDYNPLTECMFDDERRIIEKEINALTALQRIIVLRYYGINGVHNSRNSKISLVDVANSLCKNERVVYREHVRAMEKLKMALCEYFVEFRGEELRIPQ